jgi:hypothetical protein
VMSKDGEERKKFKVIGGSEKSLKESGGFFRYSDDQWERKKSVHKWQSKRQRGAQSKHGHIFFQDNWEPTWSCGYEQRIGKIGDGGKWVCDAYLLAEADECNIISIGSRNDWSFEEAIHRLNQKCKISTFDCTITPKNKPEYINYYPLCLGSKVEGKIGTMDVLLKTAGMLNKNIDILKIDCEGCEYSVYKEFVKVFIRQILIELHGVGKRGKRFEANEFFQSMDRNGYVIFHKEPNTIGCKGRCIEYGLLKLNLPKEKPGLAVTTSAVKLNLPREKPGLAVTKPEEREERESVEHIVRILEGCGEICNTSAVGFTRGLMTTPPSPPLIKHVDCRSLWANTILDEPAQAVVRNIPSEILPYLTYDGRVPLVKVRIATEGYMVKKEARSHIWRKDLIDKWSKQCGVGTLRGNYGFETTKRVFDGLAHHTVGVKGGRVLVVGSENPWVEACVLQAGAKSVTTIEYGSIVSQHPKVFTMTPNEARVLFLNGSLGLFDAVVSFSSLEHSGLGRYGDQINPWADLQHMARIWCVCKSGGGLLLGVPQSPGDSVNLFHNFCTFLFSLRL